MGGYYFKTKGLCVGYDGVPVISDVELNINRGQILSLVGPNGAGKTTILKSIIGQLSLLSGVVELDCRNISLMDKKELAKEMAVVLTNPLKTELMTVEDVVETGRYPYTGGFGILSSKDHAIVSDIMKRIHIWDLKDKDFTKISDGQKQKVMLARALAQQPDILILDEPTSYLDIKHKVEFLSILKKLAKEENLTVIMSLHEVELAGKISDRIACFKDGMLHRFGTPSEVFADDYLLELFGIQLEEIATEFRTFIMEYGKA
ncbi:MAG: ABC transporter ATP-binding protein [Lachnospiraceae bacterium]